MPRGTLGRDDGAHSSFAWFRPQSIERTQSKQRFCDKPSANSVELKFGPMAASRSRYKGLRQPTARAARERVPRSTSGRIRPPPTSIAPRQIPPAIVRHGPRHQVKAACAGRVATAQPCQGHPAASPQSKPGDRLIGIIRTRRQVSAVHADERRKRIAIERDQGPRRASRCAAGRGAHPI